MGLIGGTIDLGVEFDSLQNRAFVVAREAMIKFAKAAAGEGEMWVAGSAWIVLNAMQSGDLARFCIIVSPFWEGYEI